MTRPVVHFQIRGRDPARLREFYSRLFGWDIAEPNAIGASVIPPGIGGPEDGVGGHIVQGDPPGVSIFVQVLDPHETIALAESMGGRAILQPFDDPTGPP